MGHGVVWQVLGQQEAKKQGQQNFKSGGKYSTNQLNRRASAKERGNIEFSSKTIPQKTRGRVFVLYKLYPAIRSGVS